MCKVIQEKMKNYCKDKMDNMKMDEKTMKLFFWIMIATLIFLALRPSIMIIGSGNGNGNGNGAGSGDGNNVFKLSDNQ